MPHGHKCQVLAPRKALMYLTQGVAIVPSSGLGGPLSSARENGRQAGRHACFLA